MTDRTYGRTFAPDAIGWIDFETRSTRSIKSGTYAYMSEADALICAFAIGDLPACALETPLHWEAMPAVFRTHHLRVTQGDAVWAAWNAGFDRAAWNYATLDWPECPPEYFIDVMAQAQAAGLPPGLDAAAKHSGSGRKAAVGKALIKLFCEPDEDGAFAGQDFHPTEWQTFLDYAANDVEVMREVFRGTSQLPLAEWREYWAAEHINQRGVGCDLDLAGKAFRMAQIDKVLSAKELSTLTGGAVTAVTQPLRMIKWLATVLEAKGRAILTKRVEDVDDETGEVIREAKHSLDRARIRLLSAYLQNKEDRSESEEKALRLLAIRQYGGSTTPAKFGRMLEQSVGSVLCGQYVFNGAPQTGRFSSKGVQIHNLMRDALPYEMDAIDSLLADCGPSDFAKLGDNTPVSRKLSMLVRPALTPTNGEVFCWGDWSQIEARVLPWLAGVESRLDIFREIDADPSLPDLYTRSAASMMHVDVAEIDKPKRQRGKVAELALGFCGGRGALQNMAAAYGMHLPDVEAQLWVDQWREANPWAMKFSQKLWEAMRKAQAVPNHFHPAGRIAYAFLPDYLGGSLLCRLPSGRLLTYRGLRWENVAEVDDDGVVQSSSLELMFSRGHSRIKLWPGFFSENVTQAVAADVLRGTLVRLRAQQFDVRAHTHDEILVQTPLADVDRVQARLVAVMEQGFDWSDGLPLKAEPTIGYAYTKCEAAQGL